MKKMIIRLMISAAVFIAGLYFIGICPISPRHLAETVVSPDGKETATFFWKPAGLLGVISKDNPWVYMEIRDSASGQLLLERSTWGDTPDDGLNRFSDARPWLNKKTHNR
jgi:hypothetical protein